MVIWFIYLIYSISELKISWLYNHIFLISLRQFYSFFNALFVLCCSCFALLFFISTCVTCFFEWLFILIFISWVSTSYDFMILIYFCDKRSCFRWFRISLLLSDVYRYYHGNCFHTYDYTHHIFCFRNVFITSGISIFIPTYVSC